MKTILLSFLIILPFCAISQIFPNWWETNSRQIHYPQHEWYYGFVKGEQQPKETLENAYARLKTDARVEAISSIRMYIEKEISNNNRSELLQTSSQFEERITEIFETRTRINVEMDIPNLKIEVWQNPKTNEIGAFAYVSRNDLIRKIEKQIAVTQTKIDLTLSHINEMIKLGQKLNARNATSNILTLFAEVEQAQKLLLAISDDIEILGLTEMNVQQQKLLQICNTLQHGLKLYIQCTAILQENPFSSFQKELQASLSDLGCEFVKQAEEADWSIYINAKSRAYKKSDFEGISMYISYVDADLSVDKQITTQRVYENEFHQKGTHTNGYKEAASSAYKNLVKNISESLKNVINE